ncbi:C-type mannose receptor 2-like isoform X2 [Stigmatopora nigra]
MDVVVKKVFNFRAQSHSVGDFAGAKLHFLDIEMKASALLFQVSILLAFWAFNEVRSQPCPPGWLLYKDNCYYFAQYWSQRKSWYEARNSCQDHSADLVVIQNIGERKWLESSVKRNSWIGLSDRDREGKWKWINGAPLKYYDANWGQNQPNNIRNQDCAAITWRRHGWNDEWCTRRHGYICKRPAKVCEAGWTEYKRKCYYFSKTGEGKSWFSAQDYCEDKNAQLLIIKDLEERDWVRSQIADYAYHYIGLTDMNNEGKWEWIDTTSLDPKLANWHKGEPNNDGNKEDCVEMQGGWNDVNCNHHRGFICKK